VAIDTRFLIGPAGTGKTYRCVADVQAALKASPTGPPLLFITPKQATFQIERLVLADRAVPGYTRLRIVSFERLAELVLDALAKPPPPVLSEEGRVMVLRGLLSQKRDSLKLFHASARLPGFAQQLHSLLSELQHHQLSAGRLESLARAVNSSLQLHMKLHDLGVLLRAYGEWLEAQQLQDGCGLVESAAAALKAEYARVRSNGSAAKASEAARSAHNRLGVAGLWLDGFGDLTPQELDLLAGLLPFCEQATIAFCLDPEFEAAPSGGSIWGPIGDAYRKTSQRLSGIPDVRIELVPLERKPRCNRFEGSVVLQRLEKCWAGPAPGKNVAGPGRMEAGADPAPGVTPEEIKRALRVVTCPDVEAEATVAAREIREFVRAGGRFREAAVILRSFNGYHETIRRLFRRYDIPFFLDRREPVAHHPMAELTRCALRCLAFEWRHDDWFGALKSGLVRSDEEEVDRLENMALAYGWEGKAWLQPLRSLKQPELVEPLERLRLQLVPSFQLLGQRMSAGPGTLQYTCSGNQLAAALRGFWADWQVEAQLREWSTNSGDLLHRTVWDEMNAWLESLELAFGGQALRWREWLPIVEVGLAGLTVGVIPPALDRVLVGTIDRSRHPDLKLTILLGLNEGVFPAPPSISSLLGEEDREHLEDHKVFLGPHGRVSLAQERFFGYIACTRARERLVLTCSRQDPSGKKLNPSPFVSHLKKLFASLQLEDWTPNQDWSAWEHPSELVAPLLQKRSDLPEELKSLPMVGELLRQLDSVPSFTEQRRLRPDLVEALYGPVLRSSVSRLEAFGACAFKFFVASGLRAEERELFELDVREQGTFQHQVLAEFHQDLVRQKKRWRDLKPSEAREMIGGIAAALAPSFREGLLHARERGRFTSRHLTEGLQTFIEVMVKWMEQYQFDPAGVELPFGGGQPNALPAWELDLGGGHRLALRGQIDRVDLCADPASGEAHCIVVDYKASERRLDSLLMRHGIQLQLMAYLGVLRRLERPREAFGAERLVPSGVFYVNLRGKFESGTSRKQVLAEAMEARTGAYRHLGKFDYGVLRKLDSRDIPKGDQFSYQLREDGQPFKGRGDGMNSEQFVELLNTTEENLKRMGASIFEGVTEINPYRKGQTVACGQCDFQPICRIDPWEHKYRSLQEC
jgi:ATP-dependent helicase/nuclease subunit B